MRRGDRKLAGDSLHQNGFYIVSLGDQHVALESAVSACQFPGFVLDVPWSEESPSEEMHRRVGQGLP